MHNVHFATYILRTGITNSINQQLQAHRGMEGPNKTTDLGLAAPRYYRRFFFAKVAKGTWNDKNIPWPQPRRAEHANIHRHLNCICAYVDAIVCWFYFTRSRYQFASILSY